MSYTWSRANNDNDDVKIDWCKGVQLVSLWSAMKLIADQTKLGVNYQPSEHKLDWGPDTDTTAVWGFTKKSLIILKSLKSEYYSNGHL